MPRPAQAPSLPCYDAIVLAGGRARRLGGIDKPFVEVGGRTLLDRVLAAVADAGVTVVVGPRRPRCSPTGVAWVCEQPPGGGPVAALSAGLPLVNAPFVALLAADLPFLSAEQITSLRAAAAGGPATGVGALLVDPDGQDQLLASVWTTSALRGVLPRAPAGVALRTVLAALPVHRLTADARTCLDCDTDADLTLARSWT